MRPINLGWIILNVLLLTVVECGETCSSILREVWTSRQPSAGGGGTFVADLDGSRFDKFRDIIPAHKHVARLKRGRTNAKRALDALNQCTYEQNYPGVVIAYYSVVYNGDPQSLKFDTKSDAMVDIGDVFRSHRYSKPRKFDPWLANFVKIALSAKPEDMAPGLVYDDDSGDSDDSDIDIDYEYGRRKHQQKLWYHGDYL